MASSTCQCKEQTLTAQGPQAEAQGLGHCAQGGRQRPCGQEHCARAHKAPSVCSMLAPTGNAGASPKCAVLYCSHGQCSAQCRAGGRLQTIDGAVANVEAQCLRYCIWQRRLQRVPCQGTMPCSSGQRQGTMCEICVRGKLSAMATKQCSGHHG
jgi:hypothetical protein